MAGISAAATDNLGASAYKRRPSWVAWLVFAPLAAWLILFVIVPTLTLVALSFGEQRGLGTIEFTFTLENYQRAFNWTWLKVFWTSIWYALLTTGICMVIGYPVAYYIGRSPENMRNMLLTLVMIPFWTSFLIRTYAWITILSKEGLINSFLVAAKIVPEPITILYTPFAAVLGLVYNYLPFMILPIYTSVERLDNAMIEAAYDLGARPVRAFSQIIIPLTSPGIVAGALLVFVPSIAMFAITNLMGGGDPPTIGEVIYKQFTSGRAQPFGAALGTLLLLIFIFTLWIGRRRSEE
ncbi:spermidine/putrescine transport system permease protein [Terrimicrobium sacchariphilum]|uniref:Spermidine/putrescine transport system permease protein n=1 Tax=Terrimicrobium sacchariphilum TaxID=690879 RepID=A0A146G8A5_TERSA|nr:ABC transporter permease [Terrimicrobium sacchariphilum]GAT33107.1 spermidine/putrescine transport system permease protein [Terrimicrobium sacchariphilum]